MPHPSAEPDQIIIAALDALLRRPKILQVLFAESGGTTPQPLAYFVHFPRVYVALSGRDAMWLEQDGEARLLELRAGDAVVIPAHCWNRPESRHTGRALNLLFGRRQIGLSLVAQDGRATTLVAKVALPAAVEGAPRSIMQALLATRGAAHKAMIPLVEALLHATLEALTPRAGEPKRRTTNLHESICMYVQEHFQSPLTRDSVAAHFRISPNHVSRLFKHEGQVSFNRYVSYVRINWAKYLLRQHRQTIDEVAAMCGFTEAAYFCRVFKHTTRMTPSEYRSTGEGTNLPRAPRASF